MYETYYSGSNGQPMNGHEEHASLRSALDAWQQDCGSLQASSGGKAYLDHNGETVLEYIEHCEGGFATGKLAKEVAYNLTEEELRDPAKVAEAVADTVYTIKLAQNHHDLVHFAAWLRDKGNEVAINDNDSNEIDGINCNHDEQYAKIMSRLWDCYCKSDIK